MDKQILESQRENLLKSYDPTYSPIYIHPEEGEFFRLNDALSEIEADMKRIDYQNKYLAEDTSYLLRETVNRLNYAKSRIMAEKERLQDITMLCNKYTDFDNVIALKGKDFLRADPNSDTISAEILSKSKSKLVIRDVYGNGYEGNKYVFNDYEYVAETLFTGNRGALTDNSIATYYEYSRITASPREEELLNDFNYDSDEARCTFTLESNEPINQLDILTEWDGMQVVGIQSSEDGIDYKHIQIPKMSINKKDDSYSEYGYIYGSGKIAIPNCKYAKLTMESTKATTDMLAYEKMVSQFGESAVFEKTNIIKTAKRHLIKINDLNSYSLKFATQSIFKSKDLIFDDAYAIAIFCNVYIPEGLSSSSVEFILTVNGIDYKVQPINSHNNGIKVIRFSQGKFNPNYTKYINEVIKSAYLTIKIKALKNYSPYINNIKILVGGEL